MSIVRASVSFRICAPNRKRTSLFTGSLVMSLCIEHCLVVPEPRTPDLLPIQRWR